MAYMTVWDPGGRQEEVAEAARAIDSAEEAWGVGAPRLGKVPVPL